MGTKPRAAKRVPEGASSAGIFYDFVGLSELRPGRYFMVLYGRHSTQLAKVVGVTGTGNIRVEKFAARSHRWKTKCDPMRPGAFLRAATAADLLFVGLHPEQTITHGVVPR